MNFSKPKPISSSTARLAIGVSLTAALIAVAGCSNSPSGSGSTMAPSTPTPGAMSSAPAASTAGTLNILVIPKGTTHSYWKSIHAGAMKAKQELASQGVNVNILWRGALREDDRNGEIEVVETGISQKVDGIVLAPLDNQALVQPVLDANTHNIPVVIIDSSINTDKIASYCATNNEKGGTLDGQELGKELNGKGSILMLRYQEGSASTDDREKGFLEAISKFPGIKIVSDDQFAGPTVDTAYKSSQNLVNRFGHQVDAIFCPNESSTLGMRLALKDAGLLGKVKFFGFDSSDQLDAALAAGEINALVVQNPFKMGEQGVLTDVDAIKGKTVPKRIDTGVALITKANMADPANAALLNPPIDQYLQGT